MLQVDFGDDGSAEFRFAEETSQRSTSRARAGDDFVRIDEDNGVFTDTIPTTLDGGRGDDRIWPAARGVEMLPRRRRATTRSTATRATTGR